MKILVFNKIFLKALINWPTSSRPNGRPIADQLHRTTTNPSATNKKLECQTFFKKYKINSRWKIWGFFCINIYIFNGKIYHHQAYIYMLWYTWEEKKPLKIKKIIIIVITKTKKNENTNFKSNINLKAITFAKQKETSNLLVLIKYLMMALSMLVLFIFSRFSLSYKGISVNWALLKSRIHLTVFRRAILL